MRVKVKGFSLIELMIVIAIIGVLAAIAVPAYRNYILKAKFSELLVYGGATATATANYISEQGLTAITATSCQSMPSTINAGTPNTANVASWAVAATCIVTVTAKANVFGTTAPVVTLTPTMGADGSISWACTSGSAYAPSNCP